MTLCVSVNNFLAGNGWATSGRKLFLRKLMQYSVSMSRFTSWNHMSLFLCYCLIHFSRTIQLFILLFFKNILYLVLLLYRIFVCSPRSTSLARGGGGAFGTISDSIRDDVAPF